MGGFSRPSSARRTGNVAILRTSRSQPTIAGSSRLLASGRPASAGGGDKTTLLLATKNRHEAKVKSSNGRAGKKVLNWFRLPATGGWVPTARAVRSMVWKTLCTANAEAEFVSDNNILVCATGRLLCH